MADCYSGPNPIRDEDRYAIWRWAKENGIDRGDPIDNISKAINQKFFGGQGKDAWINDILSGRKTPFRSIATDVWRKQYNRRTVTQQAAELSRVAGMGPMGKFVRRLWTAPRTLAVYGHGVVFPVTHAGDLVFRPASWGTFIKGTLKTYRGAFSSAYTGRALSAMASDSMYDIGLQSGVDMGANSHPSGLISRSYHGPAQRAWDMLTVMRFELWKKQMSKFVEPGMSQADTLDVGKNLAVWANNATGSGKGLLAGKVGSETLFGPKLTQSKLNRITADPIQTAKTFADWKGASVGEKAVAMTRLSGSTQFLVTNLGFLAVNAGLLYALGSKEKVNYTDPTKADFLQFKGGGIEGNVPGMHSEIRALSRVVATAFASRKELRGETKFGATAKTLGQYGMGKLAPTWQRLLEVGLGQNYRGQPVPWSSDPGTAKNPRLTYGEFAGDIGPIPLSGPIGYVYDELQRTGMSKTDSLATLKALIYTGLSDPKTYEIGLLGLPGFHARQDFGAAPTKTNGKEPARALTQGPGGYYH